ncbi:MAG TPA: PQQ-binding-like beta-propeller repeat protein [Candidatus Thalassarchaeaceae archaeon]|jgi:outer membrane protein assembly factor BamB|nr:PQQ-binding-like beta-propeller repeat protein [Candidatus Thalassarchaeaceae archaeon]
MAVASLEDYSSLIREVDGECVFVRISGEFLVSGTRSGEVACWNISNGAEIWRLRFDGPCSDSACNEEEIFLTESENIHAVRMSSGEVIWSVKLEGSSDFVQISSEFVWVTSSVYNFEIQDYSEGAIWQIDNGGKVRNRWETIGRAWSLSTLEDQALMGLSRPRCGYAIVSEYNGVDYLELDEEHPVTFGKSGEDSVVILGHSNGMITEIVGGEVKSINAGDSSVRSIDYCNGWVTGLESGSVSSSEVFGFWTIEMNGTVDVVCFGPSLDESKGVWASSWEGKSKIFLIDSSEGNIDLEISHHSRIGSAFCNGETICFGDFSGCIYVIEGEVLRRRFALPIEEKMEENRSSELRRKIRGLRSG